MYKIYRIGFGHSVCVGQFFNKDDANKEYDRLTKIDPDSYYTISFS